MGWSMSKDEPSVFHVDIVNDVIQPISPIEPKRHRAAMETPEAAEWKATSEGREMASQQKNEFDMIVDMPVGRKVLPRKWVYARKHTGVVKVYKSRVVVRGEAINSSKDSVTRRLLSR